MTIASTSNGNPGSGPVGKGTYIVGLGDCMLSIAYDAGFNWKTLWNAADNSDLKRIRQTPSCLLPGDRVTIPEKDLTPVTRGTDSQHKFKLKNVPAKLVIRVTKPPDLTNKKEKAAQSQSEDPGLHITDQDPDPPEKQDDQPWSNIDYRLEVNAKTSTGYTDGSGKITVSVPPNARAGTLFLNEKSTQNGGTRTLYLNLGGLAPHDELMGIKQRLFHLGFDPGDSDNENQSDGFLAAIAAFREKLALGTGGLDQDLIDKIKQEYGG